MRLIKILSNLIFNTKFDTSDFIMPSKQRLMRNALREYGVRDWD